MRRHAVHLLVVLAMLSLLAIPVARGTVQVGQPAPGFSLTDLQGTQHSLSDYRGQVVLLALIGFG